MRPGHLLLAATLLLAVPARLAAQDDFESEFEEEEPAAAPPPSSPEAAPSEEDEFDEFDDEEASNEQEGGPTEAAGDDLAEAEDELAGEGFEASEAGGGADLDDEEERARRFRRHGTLFGPVGGVRVVDAAGALPKSFRVALSAEYFSGSDFLYPGDEQQHIAGTLALSWSPNAFLEPYAAIAVSASENSQGNPALLQALGDTTLGLKAFHAVAPWLTLGGDASVVLLNGVGGIGLGAVNFGLRALATADFRYLPNPLPFLARLNLGYVFDNSWNLVEDVEAARYRNLPSPAPEPDEYRHLLRREERFGLGVDRTDGFDVALGLEAPLQAGEAFFVHPMLEWTWSIPVNRQGYSCLLIPDDMRAPGDDSCLDADGLAAAPMDLTLGVRVLPPVQGLSLLAAVDIGLTGTGTFVREVAPNQPWNVILQASYAYDTDPPPVEVEKVVERTREVRIPPPPKGRIAGLVVDKESGQPIAEAAVRFPGRDVSPILTGPDGRFISYAFDPGEVSIEVSHPDYEAGSCAARVPEPEEGATEPSQTDVRCELQPKPRVGDALVKIVGEDGEPVSGAKVAIEGPSPRTETSGADGTFQLQGLPPGTYTARVEADGYLIKIAQFEIRARETVQPVIQLIKKPRRPLVRLRRKQIVIRRKINFATDSAEIQPESEALLTEIADVIIRHPELRRIEIQGHTDDRGRRRHNLDLSQRRAEAVRRWLIEHGVEPGRLEAKGYGPDKPLVPNITAANRARNRRVQFIILERGE